MTSRLSRSRRAVATSAAVLLLGASASACATAAGTSSGPSTSPAPGSAAPATSPPSTAPGTVVPETAVPVATELPTTTEAPTTIAPVVTAPPTLPRPPRPPPPKEGRARPPEAIALPGPAVIANEGLWAPMGMLVDGAPAMWSTTVRANGDGSVLAGIAWIDNTAVRGQLFPGSQMPGGQWSVPFNVPVEQKQSLIASFNSGFLLSEAQGGFYLEGREATPLRNGSAAVHIDTDGTIAIGALGRDVSLGPQTASIRQNLPLLVDGGAVAASATDTDTYVWGKTLGGVPYVWRSALGIRGDGSLVYVAGPSMSARMLGNTLVAAGAVRALELDINPNWVTFNANACNPDGQCVGTKLLPNMLRSPERYLTSDDRDFFALFAR
jgi:hypothetical protein